MRYIESINHALGDILSQYSTSYIIGEDIIDPYGGAFKATKGLSSKYPDRVFSTPICEATITGMAIGMALRGLLPIVEIMFGDFMTLCFDQIVNHACKFPAMYNQKIKLPVVIRTPMGGGRGYGPTHSQSLEKLFLGIPFLDVVAPSIFHTPGILLKHAVEQNNPVLFIENKLLYPEKLIIQSDEFLNRIEFEESSHGYGDVIIKNYDRLEPDVIVISYGGLSRQLSNVMREMAKEEIRILAIFIGCISPIDKATVNLILEMIPEKAKLLIIEEGASEFGWSSFVQTLVYENLKDANLTSIQRLGAENTIIPSSKDLENKVIVTEFKIIEAIKEMILI